jgi:AraC-like DNA-binding protein
MHGRQRWHLVPVVVHVLVTWPLLFVSPQRQQHILSNDFGHGDEIWTFVLGDFELALTMAQITIYILLSLRLLALHKQRLMANYSDIERISLDWLRNLLLGILMVYFIWILEELVSDDLYQGELLDAMLGLSMVVLIYAMGYLGLRQPAIFTGRIRRPDGVVDIASDETPVPTTVVSAEPEDCIEPGGKYQNSSLSAEMGAALLAELEQYMQTHKPYLDSSLSLPQLAEALSVSVNYLSQVINEHGQLNFFDYVNGYRVKEIIALMQSPEGTDRNLLELGLQAGFNSKSAFYAAFKKHQDMTPGQYRKQLVATT